MSAKVGLQVYFDLLSEPSRAVYLILKLNAVPFEENPVSILRGEQRTAKYKQEVNPFGLVPVVRDGDFLLTESEAILKYVCNSRKDYIPDHWYPEDTRKRARVDEYLAWHHDNLRKNAAGFFRTRMYMTESMLRGWLSGYSKLEHYREALQNTFHEMEYFLSPDHSFLGGLDEPSIADLQAVCELEHPIIGGYPLRDKHPRLHQYYQCVRAELGPVYDEAHSKIRRFAPFVAAFDWLYYFRVPYLIVLGAIGISAFAFWSR